jgi:hypothetical protein
MENPGHPPESFQPMYHSMKQVSKQDPEKGFVRCDGENITINLPLTIPGCDGFEYTQKPGGTDEFDQDDTETDKNRSDD